MNTRNGEKRNNSATSERKKKEKGAKNDLKTNGRKEKVLKDVENSSVASSTRTRSARARTAGSSRDSSIESSPVKRKSQRSLKVSPTKKIRKDNSNGSVKKNQKKSTNKRYFEDKTKYFEDISSSEHEEEKPDDYEKVAELPSKISNGDVSSKIPSRRSSRVSSVASSTTSSALSSLLSVRSEKRGRKKKVIQETTEMQNGHVNGDRNGNDEVKEDEYEQAIKNASPKKVSNVSPKKGKTRDIIHPDHDNIDVNFHGYTKQVSLLRSLMRSALEQVESNTVLVVGSSGAGKSALIDHCLKNENAPTKGIIIKLHGFIESDEALAFKSINRQLVNLATASHTIPALMELLIQEGTDQRKKKPFVIILDQFDVFCRKNQSLLYNLFDLTRKCKHILVIGSTTRIEAPELLEKRVKSRMNQIMIHISSPFKDVNEYTTFTRCLLKTKYGMDSLPDEWIVSLKQLYSKNSSIRELNKFVIQQKFLSTLPLPSTQSSQHSQSQSSQGYSFDRFDITTGYLTSLSNLELAVLVSVYKSCKGRKVDTFTASNVIKLSSSLPSQMVHDRSMLFKVINNLIDFKFFVLNSPVTNRTSSFMTERTEMSLNVNERNLKQALASIQNSIPSNLKNLLTF